MTSSISLNHFLPPTVRSFDQFVHIVHLLLSLLLVFTLFLVETQQFSNLESLSGILSYVHLSLSNLITQALDLIPDFCPQIQLTNIYEQYYC